MRSESTIPYAPAAHPVEIRLDRDRARLHVTWDNGETLALPAPLLRAHARDAATVRSAVDGLAAPPEAGLTIARVEPVGNYAVRLTFSDGHDRGIFPWEYLAQIAAAAAGAPAAR